MVRQDYSVRALKIGGRFHRYHIMARPFRLTSKSMGTYGWLGLAAYIAIWDWLASETLSRAWWNAVEHPRHRWLIIALWGWITAHLFLRRPAKVLYWV